MAWCAWSASTTTPRSCVRRCGHGFHEFDPPHKWLDTHPQGLFGFQKVRSLFPNFWVWRNIGTPPKKRGWFQFGIPLKPTQKGGVPNKTHPVVNTHTPSKWSVDINPRMVATSLQVSRFRFLKGTRPGNPTFLGVPKNQTQTHIMPATGSLFQLIPQWGLLVLGLGSASRGFVRPHFLAGLRGPVLHGVLHSPAPQGQAPAPEKRTVGLVRRNILGPFLTTGCTCVDGFHPQITARTEG